MTATPLLDRVAQQADDEAERRLASAREDARAIGDRAAEGRRVRRAAALARLDAALAGERSDALAAATSRTSGAVLTARAGYLARVQLEAERLVETGPVSDRFVGALGPLLAEALAYLPDGRARVRCPTCAKAAVEQALADVTTATQDVVVDEGIPLGALVESCDGTVRIDATIVGALRRRWPELAIAAIRMFEAPT